MCPSDSAPTIPTPPPASAVSRELQEDSGRNYLVDDIPELPPSSRNPLPTEPDELSPASERLAEEQGAAIISALCASSTNPPASEDTTQVDIGEIVDSVDSVRIVERYKGRAGFTVTRTEEWMAIIAPMTEQADTAGLIALLRQLLAELEQK